jgi:F1F0 ATPase subunit 2
MNNFLIFSGVLMAGILLGTIFFAGLWWTVSKGLTSNYAALWFLGSTLLRTGVVLAGFLLVSGGDWRKILMCLLGFFLARVAVTRLTQATNESPHAP